MNQVKIFLITNICTVVPVLLILSVIGSCNTGTLKGKIIITQAGKEHGDMNPVTGESWRYVSEARIIRADPARPDRTEVLTGDFYSACSPDISYDGRFMLFAAQKNINEPWQIWEMDLKKGKSRKVVSSTDNCTDPVYLPGERFIFSRFTSNDTVKSAHPLFVCNLDGSGLRQITFHPGACFATSVLKDGRLLTISKELFPAHREPILMVLRPDGTKADMFCQTDNGKNIAGRARETSENKIVFIEADNNGISGDVISVDYIRPLHTRINLTSGVEGSFNAVLPLLSGKFLVSFRRPDSGRFALYEFDPVNKSMGNLVYEDPEYDVLDVALAAKYDRPRKLPSEVDMDVRTGLLLCQDINFRGFQPVFDNASGKRASMIEVLGLDSTYGVVPVYDDGSFYLKVLADTPFQIRTLDAEGRVVHGPCTWLWLRPNERRGCTGCHEDPELVPSNRIPLAVKEQPVIIPVHITDIIEKSIELE